LTGRGEPDQITAERVSWNFFEVLGVRPVAGRTFEPEEDQPGGRQVVLISAEMATRLFNNARDAIGQNLSLDSKDYAVIGVLPTKFSIPLLGRPVDIFAPRLMDLSIVTPARIQVGGMYFEGIARLKPGGRAEQAQLAARSPTCLIESLAPTRRPTRDAAPNPDRPKKLITDDKGAQAYTEANNLTAKIARVGLQIRAAHRSAGSIRRCAGVRQVRLGLDDFKIAVPHPREGKGNFRLGHAILHQLMRQNHGGLEVVERKPGRQDHDTPRRARSGRVAAVEFGGASRSSGRAARRS
jgi:hypothetical protein